MICSNITFVITIIKYYFIFEEYQLNIERVTVLILYVICLCFFSGNNEQGSEYIEANDQKQWKYELEI